MTRRLHSILPLPFWWGGEPSVPNFDKGGSEKKLVSGGSQRVPTRYLSGGLTMFLVKYFVKWNMALRAQFSDASLGQTTN